MEHAATTVLPASAAGALLWFLGPTTAWLPLIAAGSWFVVDQVLAHPLVMGAVALADGRRPAPAELLLDRRASSWSVGLVTALWGAGAGHAAQTAGPVGVWWVTAGLVVFAIVSRSRIGAQEEVHRLERVVEVLTASAAGRDPAHVLATLDQALDQVAGVRGVTVTSATDADGQLGQPVPAMAGEVPQQLTVGAPLETGSVYVRRQDAVLQLLAAGADAYAMAEASSVLRHDAHHDRLTGLLNRAGFLDLAASELSRAARSRSTAVPFTSTWTGARP